MRNISFALTTEAIRTRRKTVTRRIGWTFLTPGTLLQPVVKTQGLKNGEHVEKVGGPIRVTRVSREPLGEGLSQSDCMREGFPGMTAAQFIAMFTATHPHCTARTIVTRIEFEYVVARGDENA